MKNGYSPLLNNEEGHIILKNKSYSRGGGIGPGKDGFKTIMSYKGTDIVEFN